MLLSGARIIVKILQEQGVDVVFGYPGGTVISVYDALFCEGDGIRHILTSHEQGAAHAADGYARATGKTGVCLVTSGPGATNLVTGIATAYMDSVPMVAITINVPTENLGKDSFQEVDIAGITMPVTKHSFIVKDVNKLAATMRRAFKIASSGRPGPVLLDITRDVTNAETEYEEAADEYCIKRQDTFTKEQIKAAAKLILKSERPLVMVGGGALRSDAGSLINCLCEKYDIPTIDTLMGKGVVDGRAKGYLGMCGMYGTAAAHAALAESDLIISVGARFSERVSDNSKSFAPVADIIHIDIDKAELNKNIPATVAIAGDASDVLDRILAQAGKLKCVKKNERKVWFDRMTAIKDGDSHMRFDCIAHKKGEKLTGPEVVRSVNSLIGKDAIVTTEVGLNQMWAATYIPYGSNKKLITSGGLGTMGFGLGAAIGAAVGNPGKKVINFAGDGCFRMNMNELLTAVKLRLPITELIFDNTSLGMVHQMQKLYYDGRYSQTEFDDNVDYAAVAKAMGAAAFDVDDYAELENVLKKSLDENGPTVIVCHIDRDEIFDLNK